MEHTEPTADTEARDHERRHPDDDDDYEDPRRRGTVRTLPMQCLWPWWRSMGRRGLSWLAQFAGPEPHHKVRGAIAQSVRRRHVAAGLKVIITDQELEFNFSVAPDPVLRGILSKGDCALAVHLQSVRTEGPSPRNR